MNIGQVFLGKYRVDSILGHGGMGVVAECTHLALNERVAVKMLRQDVLLDHDAVQRFIREAQAAVKLKSEYVARVSDVGTFENGVPYMVMEFLEGHDLGELLKQRGVLPVAWASELILQTAEALAEAHSIGIVHRDVKPTNLFVTWRPDGSALIKVLDFGISKAPMGADMQLTQTQSLLGTPAYMSPEQMRSARLVDSRSDIWSLGTVFYEILEGRRPFEADSFSEMCVKVAVDPPNPMVNTPPQLQPVIMRCLAKTPEQRYPNMAALAADLVPFVQDPHSASVLVERMNRMLRRSNLDWESSGTGANRSAVPQLSRDLGSAPVRQWSTGSDPAGQAWHGKSEPQAMAYPQRSSEPHLPNTTLVVRPKRWPVLLAFLGALIGAGVAIGIYVASSTKPAAQTVAPVLDTGSAAKAIETKPAVTETKPAITETKPVTADDPKLDTSPTKIDDPKHVATQAGQNHHPQTTTTKTTTKVTTTKLATPGKKPEDAKTTKAAGTGNNSPQNPNETPTKDTKPCDPFSAMHGCAK